MFWIRLGIYVSRKAIFFSLREACWYYCSLFACRVNLHCQKISLTLSFVPTQPMNIQCFCSASPSLLDANSLSKGDFFLNQSSICKQTFTQPVGVFLPSQQIYTPWVFTTWHALQGSWNKLRKNLGAAQIAMFSSLDTRMTAAEYFSPSTPNTHKHLSHINTKCS